MSKTFRKGQRVRYTGEGFTARVPSSADSTWGKGQSVSSGALLDVVRQEEGFIVCEVVKPDCRTSGYFHIDNAKCEAVRGKPYVEGVDPKREFGNAAGVKRIQEAGRKPRTSPLDEKPVDNSHFFAMGEVVEIRTTPHDVVAGNTIGVQGRLQVGCHRRIVSVKHAYNRELGMKRKAYVATTERWPLSPEHGQELWQIPCDRLKAIVLETYVYDEPTTPSKEKPVSASRSGILDVVNEVFATKAMELAEAVSSDMDRKLADAGLSDASTAVQEMNDRLDVITRALEPSVLTPAIKRRVALVGKAKGKTNRILEELSDFYTAGAEPPINPVLLCTPAGFGKSYNVRLLGETYDAFFEHGCSDDTDEITDLLGNPVPDGEGGFIVSDGVLIEAVRRAADGDNVLFLFDELLRLSMKAQEKLLTFLTGVKHPVSGERYFRIRTRTVLKKTKRLEVLECPARNLHFVGATNLGLVSPVPAFWDRWTPVRIEFSQDYAKAQSAAILASYGIKDSDDRLATAWATIVGQSREFTAKGRLRMPLGFRLLEGAAQMAKDDKAETVAGRVSKRMADFCANWNVDLGDIDNDSLAIVTPWVTALAAI